MRLDLNMGIAICAIGIAVLAILTAIFTLRKSNQDSIYQDQMQQLAQATKSISSTTKIVADEIKTLSELNNRLIQSTADASNQNLVLTRQINDLQLLHDDIVKNTAEVVGTSRDLIEKMEEGNAYERKRNQISDILRFPTTYNFIESAWHNKFKFMYGTEYHGGDALLIRTGESYYSDKTKFWRNYPFSFKYKDGHFLVTMDIFDKTGKLLATLDDNVWQLISNNISRYNFDDRGFEILDEFRNVIFSFDILSPNEIKVQGYSLQKDSSKILGNQSVESIEISKATDLDKDISLKQRLAGVQKLFDYSGLRWLGKRNSRLFKYQFSKQLPICGRALDVLFQGTDENHFTATIFRSGFESMITFSGYQEHWSYKEFNVELCMSQGKVDYITVYREHLKNNPW